MSNGVWSYVEQMEHEAAGEIQALAAAAVGANRLVTAVKNAAGNLKVIAWQIRYDGTVKRLGSKEGGLTTRVAVCGLSEERFVTAASTEAGGVKVTAWDITADDEIKRLGSGETGEVHGEFAIAVVDSNAVRARSGVLTPRPFADYVVVTAVRDSEDRLKLISWEVSNDGDVKRLNDILGEKVARIAIAPYDPYPQGRSCLATALITNDDKGSKATSTLKIVAWDIDRDGNFQRLGETVAGAALDVAAATLSHRRVATASRGLRNRLAVQTWDFDPDGAVSLHSGAEGDEISALDVTTLNTARVITAVRDAVGDLKLITWDAVDDVVRLGAASGDAVGLLSIVSLGSDWIATPVETASDTMKVIAWREHSVSLLRGEWPRLPAVSSEPVVTLAEADDDKDLRVVRKPPVVERTEPEQPTKKPGKKPPPMLSAPFEPGIEGNQYDPMIAVGFNFVVVTQADEIGFFDKGGAPLSSKNGEQVRLGTKDFFASFLQPTLPDGSRNEHHIQRHLGFSAANRLFRYPPGYSCDPAASGSPPPCINDFYDTRVHFDPFSRRFFIFAPARNKKLKFPPPNENKKWNTPDNPVNRRYWAFAVSKSEDPRDGFHQWMSTEAYISDGPEFTVNQGVMVIAKVAHLKTVNIQPIGLKPLVYAFAVEDLLAGKAYPRSHKVFPSQIPSYDNDELSPITHYGDTGGRTFFVEARGEDGIAVYSFKNPSDWRNFPALEYTGAPLVIGKTTVSVGRLWQREHPKFRDGKIYFTWTKLIAARVPNGSNARTSLRVVRLPLDLTATTPTVSMKTSDGFLYANIGTPDDGANLRSYEVPTIAVNKDGTMVILFCRVGYDTNPLPPEACYYAWYGSEAAPRSSQVIRSGEGDRPTWTNDAEGDDEETVFTPEYRLDYQMAVVDPADDETIWMISEYGKEGSYRTVVGTVKP